jgi:excisionase family DNA binding protein
MGISSLWLTAEQVAQHLGFHRSQIYRAIERKVITAHGRLGRTFCFDPSQLSTLLDQLAPVITCAEYADAKERLKNTGLWRDARERPAPQDPTVRALTAAGLL